MATRQIINADLVDVWEERGRKTLLRTLAWGDEVRVAKQQASTHIEVEFTNFIEQQDGSILPQTTTGFIEPSKTSGIKTADIVIAPKDNRVLKVNFVDVQQGDGSVIETPKGKVMLVDGGDNQMFARYLAGRFRGTTADNPQPVDCILVTHGDADHFSGLTEIFTSETNATKRKRFFMQPQRVYHNGIVKRPDSVPDKERLGPIKTVGDKTFLVGLEENLLSVSPTEMNKFFKDWRTALAAYNKRSKVTFRRLAFGDNDAFDFLADEDIRVEVLGPLTREISGKPALPFLGKPPKGPRVGHESLSVDDKPFKGFSASHTINGHSVVFRLSYGGFSYLFTGDLNDESSRFLAREHNKGNLNLMAEVFKVPHHGSADFSGAFVQAVQPIVSVVSSGDESARKEYIHPRATLMGALGKWSRVAEPLVFVTELVAFFSVEGLSKLADAKKAAKRGDFFGFSRAAFGIVKTRTNGQRLLVYTDSGNVAMKEAYAYQLDGSGVPQPAEVVHA
jgi:beta-lactamase superfamily II metal-dependent hydrolase